MTRQYLTDRGSGGAAAHLAGVSQILETLQQGASLVQGRQARALRRGGRRGVHRGGSVRRVSRAIAIDIVNRHCAYIRGHGSREALMSVIGKAPVRSSLARAWVCSERTALERLLPHLEHLGYSVEITGLRTAAQRAAAALPVSTAEDVIPHRARGLRRPG